MPGFCYCLVLALGFILFGGRLFLVLLFVCLLVFLFVCLFLSEMQSDRGDHTLGKVNERNGESTKSQKVS